MKHPQRKYVSAWRVWLKVRRLNTLRRKGNRDMVRHEQDRNLQSLLRFAVARCPFYADRVKGLDRAASLSDFAPTEKNEVMAHFERIVTDPSIRLDELRAFVSDPARVGDIFLDRYVPSHTSGSSGVRGIFIIDKWGWEMSQALGLGDAELPHFGRGWPRALAAPLKPVPSVAVIPTQGHFSSVLIPTIKSPKTDYLVNLRLLEITDPFEKLVGEINRIKPFSLHSYPSMLDVLARYKERGQLPVKLRLISAAGEPFTPDIRQRVQAAWPGVPIIDLYASTEVVSIARQCFHGTYHLNEDWIVMENVDNDGNPVPLGERGDKVYVTNLFNYLMPLIRYEMSDSIILDDSPCPCGSPLMGIKILGRTNHTLTLPGEGDREVMILPTPLLVAFMDVPGLRQYQVIQESRESIHINFVPDDGISPELLRRRIDDFLQRYFKKHGVISEVKRTYSDVAEIPRDPLTHKIMQIINKTAT